MENKEEKIEQIVSRFVLDGRAEIMRPYGGGHINRTYLIQTDTGRRYVLQRINQTVFKNPKELMENVAAICDFLSERVNDPRECLHLRKTVDGNNYLTDSDGECYRIYDFVEDSLSLDQAESTEDFYQSAVGIGKFQNMLDSFPAESLHETIPDFHNTPVRYEKFHKVISEDPLNRAAEVKEEIEFLLKREEEAGILQKKREAGILPVRVTHNDTKLNNILLDAKTRKALCVIDIDTVMPGLTAYDFGEAIRTGASTAAEDEADLSKVEVDLELYRIFTEGFLNTCDVLTKEEIASLPVGAKLMTLENGMRFLTDYLEGDVYFAIAHEKHNLLRSRAQLKLVRDTEKKWDKILNLFS